jgi:hypothetical protein
MFIGHFAPAIALATRKDAPSLPVLLIGAQLVDWACFGFILIGVEKVRIVPGLTVMNPMDLYHMPYTHSLIGSIAFAGAFALLIGSALKSRRAAMIGFLVVLSHWFLDLIVHAPDLTLMGSPPKLGFGLWNYPMLEMPLEIGIVAAALLLFAKKRGGWTVPLITLSTVMALLQAVNWFGPPPMRIDASVTYLAWFAFGVVALLGWWVHARTKNHAASLD